MEGSGPSEGTCPSDVPGEQGDSRVRTGKEGRRIVSRILRIYLSIYLQSLKVEKSGVGDLSLCKL